MQSKFELLSNADLHTQTVQAARHDRRALVHFLQLLGELDARRAYREAGYSSTWAFLRDLGYSESETASRLVAGRVVHRYPWVGEDLMSATLHLTALAMVGRRVLETGESHLLERARGLTKEELQVLLTAQEGAASRSEAVAAKRARIVPIVSSKSSSASRGKPDGASKQEVAANKASHSDREMALPLFAAARASGSSAALAAGTASETDRDKNGLSAADERASDDDRTADLYRMTLFLGPEARGDLRNAQRLARHQVPGGDLNRVVALALREFVQRREARKHGMRLREQKQQELEAQGPAEPGVCSAALASEEEGDMKATREQSGPQALLEGRKGEVDNGHRVRPAAAAIPAALPRKRYIPASIRRAVFIRDGGRCTFCSTAGRICGERQMLEYDHIVPFALGGPHSVGNLRLRCRAHNALWAETLFLSREGAIRGGRESLWR